MCEISDFDQDRLTDLTNHQEKIAQLVTKGHDLERNANEPSRVAVSNTLDAIKKRWNDLNTQAEETQAAALVSQEWHQNLCTLFSFRRFCT